MSGFSISGWASAPAAASFWLALGQQPLQRFLEGSVLLRLPFGAAPQPAARLPDFPGRVPGQQQRPGFT